MKLARLAHCESPTKHTEISLLLQQIHPVNFAIFDITPSLHQQLIPEPHDHSKAILIGWLSDEHLLTKPGVHRAVREGPESTEDAKGWKAAMYAVNKIAYITSGLDKT